MIRRLVRNDGTEPKFIAFSSTRTRDAENYYLYHGTFLNNIPGIRDVGLDPTQGGGARGASRYEKHRSHDAAGVSKFATDPNLAMIYAREPATTMKPPEVGVLLEARVRIADLRAAFDEQGHDKPFWRTERGGENSRPTEGPTDSFALNEPDVPWRRPVLAVETNITVPPSDLRVLGVYLPPGVELDEEREFGGAVRRIIGAIAIDMKTFEVSELFESVALAPPRRQ